MRAAAFCSGHGGADLSTALLTWGRGLSAAGLAECGEKKEERSQAMGPAWRRPGDRR